METTIPSAVGEQEGYTPTGTEVLQALLDQVLQGLDAQKAEQKPCDPRLQELMLSIMGVQNKQGRNSDLTVPDAIKSVWQQMPEEFHQRSPLEDPFFQCAEHFVHDLDYYKSSEPQQAAEDFAQEWMDTYRDNLKILEVTEPPLPVSEKLDATKAMEKLKQLLGDHDFDVDINSEELTAEEYSKSQKEKRDLERRQAIRDGRTELPRWTADLNPDEIRNVERGLQLERKKQKDRDYERRKVDREQEENMDKEKREIERAKENAQALIEGMERSKRRKEAKEKDPRPRKIFWGAK